MNKHDHTVAISTLLEVKGLGKTFPGASEPVVANASFTVGAGEIFALIGPSGCGKSTTLRMIAGLEIPDTGSIELDGTDVTHAEPERRNIGIVFQDYALFPHLTVNDNVAFAIRDKEKRTRRAAATRYLDMVGLTGFGERFPDQLSGGQQQRVALARTFAAQPRLILLDEPFSNLDAALRHNTRREIRGLLKQNGLGAIFVTHDQEEAFELSDRIAIMQGGTLQQVGTPELLYLQPVNPFVATFLGRANFLEGRVLEWDRDEHEQEEAAGTWLLCELPGGVRWRVRAAIPTPGEVARIMVRPEALAIAPASHPEGIEATITERLFAGPATLYRVRVAEVELSVLGRAGDGRPGDRVRLHLTPDAVPLAFAPQIPRPGPAAQNVSPSPTVTVGT